MSDAPPTPEAEIRRHVMLHYALKMTDADAERLQPLAARLTEQEIAVVTLAGVVSGDADAIEKAYRCHNDCRRRQPPVELRREPIPFDVWRRSSLDGADALPELYFAAKSGGEYIGVCMLHRAETPRRLVCGFTGVLPAFSGRGVATALKAYALLAASAAGWREFETSCLQINRGICAVNATLGFAVVGRRLHTYCISWETLVPERE